MRSYAFSYRGEVLPNQSKEQVQRRLAQLFRTPPDSLECLFNAQAIFEVSDLYEEVAQAYERTFRSAGAVGQITANDNNTPHAAIDNHAPAAASFASSGLGVGPIDSANIAEPANRPTATLTDSPSLLATRWLQYSAIAILGILALDEELKSLMLGPGIDMGVGPLIFAHLSLIIGCFLFARDRGLNPLMGLLGIFSLVGVSVLIMAASRRQGENITIKQMSMFVFASVIVFYWSQDWAPPTKLLEEHAAKTAALHQGREEFPSKTLNQNAQTYLHEQKEMEDYLNWSIQSLMDEKLRPDAISAIADDMFRALARYQAWRNYQHFLHLDGDKALPSTLDRDGEDKHDRKFKAILSRLNVVGPTRLKQAKMHWVDMYSEKPSPVRQFSATLEALLNQFRFKSMQPYQGSDQEPSIKVLNRFDMSPLIAAFGNGLSAQADGNLVVFKFDNPKLNNKALHVAFYWSREWRRKKWQHIPNLRIVSAQFPLEHLHGYFHIFRQYR